jgi:hypothetical protein
MIPRSNLASTNNSLPAVHASNSETAALSRVDIPCRSSSWSPVDSALSQRLGVDYTVGRRERAQGRLSLQRLVGFVFEYK